MEALIGGALLYSFATHRRDIYQQSKERVQAAVDHANKAAARDDDDNGYDASQDDRTTRGLYEPGQRPTDASAWGHPDRSVVTDRFEYTGNHDHVVEPLTDDEMLRMARGY